MYVKAKILFRKVSRSNLRIRCPRMTNTFSIAEERRLNILLKISLSLSHKCKTRVYISKRQLQESKLNVEDQIAQQFAETGPVIEVLQLTIEVNTEIEDITE